MSGLPINKQSDATKFRQEYLDSLNLQVQINNANEEAVKNFVATGQVPPISQMKDMRTTTQILADVEKLKINLIKDLEPIADPQFAQNIVQKLVSSPLNVDNKLLVFVAQRIGDIVKNLQKSYKYGIKGDENDAINFVSYMNKFFTDKNKTTTSAKSFFNRMGESKESGTSTGATQTQYSSYISLSADWNVIYKKFQAQLQMIPINLNRDVLNNISRIASTIDSKFRALISILPKSSEDVSNVEKLLVQFEGTPMYDRFFPDVDKYLNFINHNIPVLSMVSQALSESYKSVQNIENVIKTGQLQNISPSLKNYYDNLLSLDGTIDIDLDELKPMNRLIDRVNKEVKDYITNTQAGFSPEALQQGPVSETLKDDYGAVERALNEIRDKIYNIPQYVITSNRQISDELDRTMDEIEALEAQGPNSRFLPFYKGLKSKLDKIYPKLLAMMPTMGPLAPGQILRPEEEEPQEPALPIPRPPPPIPQRFGQYFLGINPQQPLATTGPLGPVRRPRANGLATQTRDIKGKGLPIDYSKGIEASPRYVKFGRYVINNKKLNDNVLSLRRPKGSSISTIPANKMSSNLGKIVKQIVGGGVPSYDDLNKLTDDEKRYLYKVSQEADIYDKIKIPTPSKDQEEKDIHQFNVMKGEILAGNNSKELISKFKALLLKLTKQNILPKSQVNEILEELLELGI